MSKYDLSPLISRPDELKDARYAAFNAGIVPSPQYDMSGIRMPMLRVIAKEIICSGDRQGFLDGSRDHCLHEVRMLHGMVLGGA